MQLLQDTFIIENLQVLSEGKGDNKMRVKGVFGRCNEKNNNGRIYPTAVLEHQLKKVQPMISERRLCGELDHPQNDTVKLSNASHLITKLEMKGNELIGEAELLNTPAGLTAQALVKGGVKIGISSRGMGTLSEDHNGNKIVNEDFRLVTFDLVADPSTRGAYPALSESTESRFVRDTVGKLEKERNFLTILESTMRQAYEPILSEKKSFPDLNNDGEITKADVLVGRGVIPGPRGKKKGRKRAMRAVQEEGSWHMIAYTIADGFNLLEATTELERSAKGQEVSSDDVRGSGDKREGIVKSYVRGRLRAGEAKRTAAAKGKGAAQAARATSKEAAKDKIRQARAAEKAKNIKSKGIAARKAAEAKAKAKAERRAQDDTGKAKRNQMKQDSKTAEAQKRQDRYGATTLGGIAKRKAFGAVKDAKKKLDSARKNRAERKASEAGKPKEDKGPGIVKRATDAAKKFVKDRADASVRGAERGAERAAVMRQSQSDRRKNRAEAQARVDKVRRERERNKKKASERRQAELAANTKRADAIKGAANARKAAADAQDTARRNADASKASQERAEATKVGPTPNDTDKKKTGSSGSSSTQTPDNFKR